MGANRYGTVALIVAAGRGERAGDGGPKQYRKVAGRAVIGHAVDALARHEGIDLIVPVIGAGQDEMALAAIGRDLPLVTGAGRRQDSVRAGLEWIERQGGADRVLIHDAARPFLPGAVIDRLLAALAEVPGAIPALPVADTLVRGDGALVPRDGLWRVQTPQAFRFDAIMAAHRTWDAAREATDDAQMLRACRQNVRIVAGDERLQKLTYPEDFARAEAMLGGGLGAARSTRTGMGYDVHRLVAGEELWLCGVQVPHTHGLSGHSDADVAIHALVDAILGALAEGDIGQHFPPSDAKWRGAASSRFLEYARDRVAARHGVIEHVDVTIICEAPKIGPHRDAMQARIVDLLGVAAGRVSIKATTTERLGFAGRREGIAAQAVATLSLPALD
jgi:2-C-methyl-D-erythritol 4-phosphate cytidylyltransferase/2-C-methyl-D-erythritol 2,4-cyclodiphosphate synthase